MRAERGGGLELAAFKELVRDQFLMLVLDPEEALASLPRLLGDASAARIREALDGVGRLVTAGGALGADAAARLAAVERIFEEAARGTGTDSLAAVLGETARVAATAPGVRRLAVASDRETDRRKAGSTA